MLGPLFEFLRQLSPGEIAFFGTIFSILSGVAGYFLRLLYIAIVPRSPEFVFQCIEDLRAMRSALDGRTQIFDPISGGLYLKNPNSFEELYELCDALMYRHDENKAVYREIRYLFYPSQRGPVKTALKTADKAIKSMARKLRGLRNTESDAAFQRQFNPALSAMEKAANKMINFEKRLLKAIDRSLELWSKRIR